MTGGRVTSHDVARHAGVSRSTVSYVLNDTPGQTIPAATRTRVLEAVRALGYRPSAAARGLRRGRGDFVVLLLPAAPVGPALAAYTAALAGTLDDRGLTTVVRAHTSAESVLALGHELAPAAVVTLAGLSDEVTAALTADGVVVVDTVQDAPGLLGSHGMHLAVGTTQAEHLVGLGHLRLGWAGPADPSLAGMASLRLAGVREVCARAELPAPVEQTVALDLRSAAAAVDSWTRAPHRVTAVAAYNDDVAFALLAALRERGVDVPRRLAVIGADDVDAARFAAPPLSTVDLRPAERARAVAHHVLERLGLPVPDEAPAGVDGVGLVVRASTAGR